MDNVKALEILKESAETSRQVYRHLLGDNVPPRLRQGVDAIEIAIDAVGKQIPKPAKVEKREGYIIPLYLCPDCGETIGDAWRYTRSGRYCANCGQRLSF